MDVNSLVSLTQTLSWVTSSQVSDTITLQFANLAYHEIEELIRNDIDEDYFYDYFTTDTRLNQSEYNFASIAPTSLLPGILKIISVGVMYSNADTAYRTVRAFGSGSLYSTPEYTQVNQPNTDPFYIYKDNSLFLYPYPDNDGNTALATGDVVVSNGLRVHCSVSLIDLVSGWAETTIKIPRNHHRAIALKAATYIYLHRNLWGTAIAQDIENKANIAIATLKSNLKDRTLTPVDQDMPVLTNIMY